ncbi:MAG: GGDEF domain-containing protein, partial [Lachnospiraceae bacterium]
MFSKDIQRANAEKEEQFNILKSMSGIYYSMHLINLTENTVSEYSSRNEVKEIVNRKSDADMQMRAIMTATVEEKYLDRVLKFTDLTTLSERMKAKKNISLEFVAKNYGWFRCEFIAIEADEQTGCPDKVMFTTQIIDEEKRREEELKLLSSTDGLTGLLNRRAYIEDIAREDSQGSDVTLVYLAIDINGLKSTNDKLGHEAGDELIKGAAECINLCFKDYGKAYRTGGDEIVVIFKSDKMKLDKIKADFEKTVAGWSGEIVDSLSVS